MTRPAPPWYSAGLRFACQRCGRCCRGEPGFVWVTGREIAQMAESLAVTPHEFIRTYVRQVSARLSLKEWPGGDCVLWGGDERGCLVYPVRPLQCRTFPFWREHLASPRAWAALALRCPGLDRGPLHPPAQIRTALRSKR